MGIHNMETRKIEDVDFGDFIKRKPNAKKVYQRTQYCRMERRYICDDWDDISRNILLRKGTIVYVDFEF
jgi:hypothetical protein